jgi:hypothetical protein
LGAVPVALDEPLGVVGLDKLADGAVQLGPQALLLERADPAFGATSLEGAPGSKRGRAGRSCSRGCAGRMRAPPGLLTATSVRWKSVTIARKASQTSARSRRSSRQRPTAPYAICRGLGGPLTWPGSFAAGYTALGGSACPLHDPIARRRPLRARHACRRRGAGALVHETPRLRRRRRPSGRPGVPWRARARRHRRGSHAYARQHRPRRLAASTGPGSVVAGDPATGARLRPFADTQPVDGRARRGGPHLAWRGPQRPRLPRARSWQAVDAASPSAP